MTDQPATSAQPPTVMDQDDVRQAVDAYLAATGITPTKFSKDVTGDPMFVADLRRGRVPNVNLAKKVIDHIRNPAPSKPEDRIPESVGAAQSGEAA